MSTNHTSLNEAALDIASKASSTASELYAKTAEVLARETPLLADEYVRWFFWSNAIEFLSYALLAAIPLVAMWQALKRVESMEGRGAIGVFGSILTIIAICISLCNGTIAAQNMVKAHVAPRVVLVEFVAQQMKL